MLDIITVIIVAVIIIVITTEVVRLLTASFAKCTPSYKG
jgi:hypothetical protein